MNRVSIVGATATITIQTATERYEIVLDNLRDISFENEIAERELPNTPFMESFLTGYAAITIHGKRRDA